MLSDGLRPAYTGTHRSVVPGSLRGLSSCRVFSWLFFVPSCLRVFVATLATFVLAGTLLGACSRDPQVAKAKYIASGDEYAAAGKLAEAIIEYKNAVQQDPRAGDARLKLADAYTKAGALGNAIDEYVRAADLLPEDSEAHLKAGSMQLLARRFDEAKAWADKVLAREPKNLQAQLLLANALAGLRDLDGAVVEIEEAIRLDPSRGQTYTNLGAFELGRGQKEAAEQAFTKAVELAPQSPEVRLALANFYWASARWLEAEKELKNVIEIEPGNALAQRVLAAFYIATRRPAEAEPHLKKVQEITKTPAASFALADYYAAGKNDASARAVLEPLAGATETASLAEVKLAALDRRDNHPTEAYERLARVLEKDQTNLDALLMKSALLLEDGRLEDALSNATLATEKHRGSTGAFFTLGRVQTARHQTEAAIAAFDEVLKLNPRATDAKSALARLHLAAGRPDTSVGLAREVVAAAPQNADARITMVRGLLSQKDVSRARVELDALYKQSPDSAPVNALMGVLRGLQRDEGGARKSFERALEIDPDSLEASGGLVALDLAGKRHAEARARVDERLARSPKNPLVLMLAAHTYSFTGDPAKAEAMLRRAIENDPSYLDAYSALAQLYVSQQRLDAALAEYDELAKRQPRPVGPLTFAGMILQGQGKTNDARDRYIRALQIDPDAAVAANNLAWMYAETDDNLDRALELALRARAKLPDRADVNDTVGWVHYRKDRAAEAIPYFEKSVEKDANNPIYHYHLGLALAKSGDAARGRQALERALKIRPDFDGAATARQTLAALP